MPLVSSPPPMLSLTFRGTPQQQMHHRGRSRHISPVALARQASEERRHAATIPLEDQIQVAYALDNIRLAKKLLLKLKGVHVADDNDPRIDQVRDEEFDVCFAPSGPLTLDDAVIRESQHRQKQWWHESQRAQRLRTCEKLWEDDKNQLHADKLRAMQRREHEQERARLAEKTTPATGKSRPVDTVTKRDQDPFQYPFMTPSKPSSSSRACKKTLTRSPGRHNRAVSFKDVINAMNGQLFPLDLSERADDARRIAGLPIPCSTPHRRKASVRAELLDSLLQVVEWQQGERRKVKGKDVVREQPPPKSQPFPLISPPSLPSSLSAASLSSSASTSRPGSWLTFGSWRSTATDITTPDSPVSISPTLKPCLIPTLIESQPELHPRCAFVRISFEESPLCPPSTSPHSLGRDDGPAAPSVTTTDIFPSLSIRGVFVDRVTRSVATVIEAAKGLQSAYIAATIFSAGFPYTDAVTPSQPRELRYQHPLRHEGYRALTKDVRRFTDSTTSDSQLSEPVHFIPLVSQPSGAAGLPKPATPKNAVIFPSPLRPRTPPAALAYRMRPVANPAVLRLRALQNIMDARGKQWEGRGREGGLGCGKDRMLGIAFEGRGRSGLGCEVRFVVA